MLSGPVTSEFMQASMTIARRVNDDCTFIRDHQIKTLKGFADAWLDHVRTYHLLAQDGNNFFDRIKAQAGDHFSLGHLVDVIDFERVALAENFSEPPDLSHYDIMNDTLVEIRDEIESMAFSVNVYIDVNATSIPAQALDDLNMSLKSLRGWKRSILAIDTAFDALKTWQQDILSQDADQSLGHYMAPITSRTAQVILLERNNHQVALKNMILQAELDGAQVLRNLHILSTGLEKLQNLTRMHISNAELKISSPS